MQRDALTSFEWWQNNFCYQICYHKSMAGTCGKHSLTTETWFKQTMICLDSILQKKSEAVIKIDW